MSCGVVYKEILTRWFRFPRRQLPHRGLACPGYAPLLTASQMSQRRLLLGGLRSFASRHSPDVKRRGFAASVR